MKFLVDAHLPKQLVFHLRSIGHDALHTRDLPLQNRTPDEVINQLSLEDERVVVTKDSDFVDSHLVSRKPYKLLLVLTGNIKNDELLRLFEQSLPQIVAALADHSDVELGRNHLTIDQ